MRVAALCHQKASTDINMAKAVPEEEEVVAGARHDRLVVDGAGAGHDAVRRLHRDAVRAVGRAAPVPLPVYHTI